MLLASCWIQPALAYDSAKLEAALESLSPATLPAWEKQAGAGDPVAQNVLGMAYKYGEVITQNPALSLQWFLKSAQQGDADAQFNLGRIYGKATGSVYAKQRAAPRDDGIAADWYRKAAKQNYAPAQFNLAEMYADSSPSFPRDVAQAFFWMQLAASGGGANALAQLEKIKKQLSAADAERARIFWPNGRRLTSHSIALSTIVTRIPMPHSSGQPSFWQRNLDKIGIGGAAFAALCCLGFPALLAIMSAIGLGFLVNDAVLLPFLTVSLLIALWALWSGTRHHHRWSAFAIGVVGAILLGLSIGLGMGIYAGIGIAALVLTSVLNIVLRVRAAPRTEF